MNTDEIDREVAKRCATVTPYSLADWLPIAAAWRGAGHDPDRLSSWVHDNARNGMGVTPDLVAAAISSMDAVVPPAKPLASGRPPTALEDALTKFVLVVISLSASVICLALAWGAVRWVLR